MGRDSPNTHFLKKNFGSAALDPLGYIKIDGKCRVQVRVRVRVRIRVRVRLRLRLRLRIGITLALGLGLSTSIPPGNF